MKTHTPKLLFLLALTLIFQGCSSTPPKKIKHNDIYARLGNFDKVYIPNDASLISQMISIVQPELDVNARNKIANNIHHAIKKYKIEPQIMVSLIDTESNFSYSKISTTGDLSLGQVNVEIWNKEFKRMKIPLIKKAKLVTEDQAYAMEKMAQILSILKKRHAKKDRRWYARYHSNTKKYKMDYFKKIELRMKLLADSRMLTTQKSLASFSQNTP